ncbi:hypothetical protein EDB19DRAFT_1929916 [Suillus lakei]|nr:hypothetical protein EDB19DRAFT_1929916 [Suillus lakei]
MPTFNVPINQSHFNLNTSNVAGFFGWYNSPGSYTVAKKFGQLANSRLWDGLFPGPNLTPAEVFGLDGKPGPRYWGVFSGTDMTTGHLAYLSRDMRDFCSASGDWLAFALIMIGVISSGISCLVMGSAQLEFTSVKEAAPGVPPADGDVIIIRGAEKDIDPITKGSFCLKMNGGPEFRRIGFCSLLLLAQFLIQLLLIPQATTFGQIMFISSLAASWAYNSFLSSLEQEKIQINILMKALRDPRMLKISLKNRAAQAVFACLVLGDGARRPPNSDFKPKEVLQCIIPNETRVWNTWRDKVMEELEKPEEKAFGLDFICDPPEFRDDERKLLTSLFRDAQSAYRGYQEHIHKIRSILDLFSSSATGRSVSATKGRIMIHR